MRENSGGGAEGVGEHADGQIEVDVTGHEDEGTVGEEGFVERGELRRAEFGRLGEEMLADDRLVFYEGALECIHDDATGGAFLREEFAGEETAVGKDEFGGLGNTDGRVGDGSARQLGVGGRQGETVEGERTDVAEAPHLVGAGGHRERSEAGVSGAFAIEPPSGKRRREAGEVRGEGFGREGAGERGGSGERVGGHGGLSGMTND